MIKLCLAFFVAVTLFLCSVSSHAADKNHEIKSELISALIENRPMRTEAFSKQELAEFFAPAFSFEKFRERFIRAIDVRLPKKRAALITAVYDPRNIIFDKPTLTFEMDQGDHLRCIIVFPEGVVLFEEQYP